MLRIRHSLIHCSGCWLVKRNIKKSQLHKETQTNLESWNKQVPNQRQDEKQKRVNHGICEGFWLMFERYNSFFMPFFFYFFFLCSVFADSPALCLSVSPLDALPWHCMSVFTCSYFIKWNRNEKYFVSHVFSLYFSLHFCSNSFKCKTKEHTAQQPNVRTIIQSGGTFDFMLFISSSYAYNLQWFKQ